MFDNRNMWMADVLLGEMINVCSDSTVMSYACDSLCTSTKRLTIYCLMWINIRCSATQILQYLAVSDHPCEKPPDF